MKQLDRPGRATRRRRAEPDLLEAVRDAREALSRDAGAPGSPAL